MATPVRTHTGKQLLEALDTEVAALAARRTELRGRDMDEESTFVREAVRRQLATVETQIDIWERARGTVRSLVPFIESDAVQRAMPGIGLTEAEFLLGDPAVSDKVDEPADPTLPFVLEMTGAPA